MHITSFLNLAFLNCHPHHIGGHQYPPHSAQAQAPQGASNFDDGSGPIFWTYLEMAAEEDKKMAESWKADADGILIFVRLSFICASTELNRHRLVYSLLLLRH